MDRLLMICSHLFSKGTSIDLRCCTETHPKPSPQKEVYNTLLKSSIVHNNKNTGKGVKANVEKKLSCDNYECCLRSLSSKCVDSKGIGSDNHMVFTYSTQKIGLYAFDTEVDLC